MRTLIATAILVLLTILAADLRAQETAITNGVDWLITNQDASGLWGVDKQTPFRDAAVVLDVLGGLDADSTAIDDGLSAIRYVQTTSTDYLARKITAMLSCGEGYAAALVDSLAGMQNDDGGWGYSHGYGSNVLETALALKALKGASYSDMGVLGIGVGFLTNSQDADSGWSFVAGDSSMVFFTAHAIIALAMLESDFGVSTEIETGTEWLKAQDHPDGGFGTGGVSNPYETGLAMAAIVKGDPTASEILDAMTYLETTQLPNGSWNDDAYSTALAVYGLNHVGPDLAISASDIVLSNPVPSDSETVSISATVHNHGILSADSILVQVFDGDPDFGGIQIGSDVTIYTLVPTADSTIQVDWFTYPLAGDHDIYVLVDPFNEIREPEKLNNIAIKPVHVYFPPDLIIDTIIFDPPEPEPSEQVIIKTTVKNTGELTAANVLLQVWVGDPTAGGIPLLDPPFSFPSIGPGSSATLNLNMGTFFDTAGIYPIYACADVDSSIREISEYNNCGNEDLHVGPTWAVDLSTGLNLLGLCLDPYDPQTSYTMIPDFPNCNEIDGWNRATQSWITAIDIDGMIFGDEFPIELRDGFFARVTDEGSTIFRGSRVSEHLCTYLEQGLNMVSVPNQDACYTGYTMIDDIDSCVEAHSWNKSTQLWVTAIKVGEGVFIGEDFSVTPGNGFFVKVNATGNWCTRTCDTLPEPDLPDLLVTPADIYINPNPATSGTSITFAMNVTNIGGDTAFTPRIDMYLGDPDDGGTLLFWGNIPDVLPGEASGLYGMDIIIEGSGTVPVFGVADFANEIEEMDEGNNQASQNLTINPAAVMTHLPPSGLTISQTTSNAGIDLKPLRWWIGFIPESEPPDPAAGAITSSSGTNGVVVAAAVSSSSGIENVRVGNHSSSSVTISWITYESGNGYVAYGETTTLGSALHEDRGASEQHFLVLNNLSENVTYYYEIVSNGIVDNNKGDYYSFTTTEVGAGVPYALFGCVVATSDNSPIDQTIISGTLRRGDTSSYPLIGSTDSDGMWLLNLGNLKDDESGSVLSYEVGDTIFLEFSGNGRSICLDTIFVSGSSPQNCGVFEIETEIACGDVDGSGEVSIDDIIALLTYVFHSAGENLTVPESVGDVNCSGGIDIDDIVYLINFVFGGGPPPCDGC